MGSNRCACCGSSARNAEREDFLDGAALLLRQGWPASRCVIERHCNRPLPCRNMLLRKGRRAPLDALPNSSSAAGVTYDRGGRAHPIASPAPPNALRLDAGQNAHRSPPSGVLAFPDRSTADSTSGPIQPTPWAPNRESTSRSTRVAAVPAGEQHLLELLISGVQAAGAMWCLPWMALRRLVEIPRHRPGRRAGSAPARRWLDRQEVPTVNAPGRALPRARGCASLDAVSVVCPGVSRRQSGRQVRRSECRVKRDKTAGQWTDLRLF